MLKISEFQLFRNFKIIFCDTHKDSLAKKLITSEALGAF